MRKIILCTLLPILLFSCTSFSELKERRDAEQRDLDAKLAEIKANKYETEQLIYNLVKKYNIKYAWDTLFYDYTIDYAPVIQTQYQLIDNYRINDIYEKDGSQYISLKTGYSPRDYFYLEDDLRHGITFDLMASKEQIDSITSKYGNLIFVVNITDIIKKQPSLFKGECNIETVENMRLLDIALITMPEFIGNGKIIDIISITNK